MTQEERIQDLENSLNEALFKNAELDFDNERLTEEVASLRWDVDYWRDRYHTATDNFGF